jgi:hypothetical protein
MLKPFGEILCPNLKFNRDKLRGGITTEEAISLVLGACNKPDRMFITELDQAST